MQIESRLPKNNTKSPHKSRSNINIYKNTAKYLSLGRRINPQAMKSFQPESEYQLSGKIPHNDIQHGKFKRN